MSKDWQELLRDSFVIKFIVVAFWFGLGQFSTPASSAPLSAEPQRVIYQMYVRSFADGSLSPDGQGDFRGILRKLDYLKELGVDTLLLMPIFHSTGNMGYIPRDYFALDQAYGDVEDFREVVAALKLEGFKVILDAPVNHISFDSHWFLRGSQKNCDPRDIAHDPLDPENVYCDFFYFSRNPCGEEPYQYWHKPWKYNNTDCTAVWFPRPGFDPAYHRPDYVYATFFNVMPDLKFWDFTRGQWNFPVIHQIKRFFEFWTSLGVDGYRIDAAKHFVEGERTNANPQEPRNRELLAMFLNHVRTFNPEVIFLGEIWAPWREFEPYLPDALDLTLDFPFMEGVRSSVAGNYGERFKQVLAHFQSRGEEVLPGNRVVFAGNHDVSRMMTDWGDDEEKLKLAHFLSLSTPFIPLLYYGEELGMHGKVKRPDENSDEEYVRTINAFPWVGDEPTGGWGIEPLEKMADNFVTRNLATLREDPRSSFNMVKELLRVRREMGYTNEARVYVEPNLYGHVIGWVVVQPHGKGDSAADCFAYVVNFDAHNSYQVPLRELPEGCLNPKEGEILFSDQASAREGEFELQPYGKIIIKL